MKKFKMSTSIIIIVVSVAAIVGVFLLLTRGGDEKNKTEDTEISAAQNILLRNMDNNYPPTPKEVLKYYSDITQCFYSGKCTDDEITKLADRSLELFDAELIGNQNYDTYIKDLKAEIADYKKKDWSVSSYSTSSSLDVEEFERDGYQWAQLYAFYNVRQSTELVKVTERFLMRKDGDGRWKIFGWEQVKDTQ